MGPTIEEITSPALDPTRVAWGMGIATAVICLIILAVAVAATAKGASLRAPLTVAVLLCAGVIAGARLIPNFYIEHAPPVSDQTVAIRLSEHYDKRITDRSINVLGVGQRIAREPNQSSKVRVSGELLLCTLRTDDVRYSLECP